MKSAKEWADEMIEDRQCWEFEDWNFDPDGQDDVRVRYVPDYAIEKYVAELARAIQSDAIKACAERAESVGRAMADGYKETSCPHCNDGQVAAGNTGALARENILSLLPKD